MFEESRNSSFARKRLKQGVVLYEEYKLIELKESDVNGAWKGAHLLLFFLAFIFGSFCTFCFHMLMYMFDDKCVLFPKLLSLSSQRSSKVYDILPVDKDTTLPVDFLSTQWVDQSVCYMPTYVPLVSGIFGLVWITMFLMYSSGTHTGLQRQWRMMLPVFIFSLAMGGLCVYSSIVTHSGLSEFCRKIGEATGTFTCSYAINVITMAFERRITGVYQATRLTILSAWIHTSCWLLSALLVVLRVGLVVDFQLVKVTAELHGDIDDLLQRNERQIRTVSPDPFIKEERKKAASSQTNETEDDPDIQSFFHKKNYETNTDKVGAVHDVDSILTRANFLTEDIKINNELPRVRAYNLVEKRHRFIVDMIYDITDNIDFLHEYFVRSYELNDLMPGYYNKVPNPLPETAKRYIEHKEMKLKSGEKSYDLSKESTFTKFDKPSSTKDTPLSAMPSKTKK